MMKRLTQTLVALVVVALPLTAFADLYKYRAENGNIIITTEKRSDLELVEVVSGSKPKKSTSRPKRSSKASKRTSSKSVARTSKPRTKAYEFDGPRQKAFDDIIREASKAYDVPFSFIKAVIRVESNFKPNATSHAGAMGLMQLMPRTAASLNVTDPYDPRQNIFGGAKFLRILIDRYDGDINLILAAYNAGDAAVARYDGIPYSKTRGYVASVFKYYRMYRSAEGQE